MTEPTPTDLVHELREALGLGPVARPEPPRQVWEETLDIVRALARGECWSCHELNPKCRTTTSSRYGS